MTSGCQHMFCKSGGTPAGCSMCMDSIIQDFQIHVLKLAKELASGLMGKTGYMLTYGDVLLRSWHTSRH